MRLRELRERVADGGDPTKLHEPPIEQISDTEQETGNSAQLFVNFSLFLLFCLFKYIQLWKGVHVTVVYFLEWICILCICYLSEFSAKNDAISIPSKEADTVMEDIFDEEGMQEDVLDEIYRKATEVRFIFQYP